MFSPIFAQVEGEVQNIPLGFQISWIVLSALFLWTFSIARNPRGWRRLYQAKFQRSSNFSVNKNKQIDERIKKYGILIAMTILMLDVSLFVYGFTYRHRANQRVLTKEEQLQREDMNNIKSGEGSRRAAF